MQLFVSFSQSQKHFRTREDMGQFAAGPVNKAVPSFRKKVMGVCEAIGGHFEYSL